MVDVLAGNGVEITFSEGKMIDTVEDIGFSDPVIPHYTIYLSVKMKFCRCKILVIE